MENGLPVPRQGEPNVVGSRPEQDPLIPQKQKPLANHFGKGLFLFQGFAY